jgi:hypothetical protein
MGRTSETTASTRHKMRSDLVEKLAREICPHCAHFDILYEPRQEQGKPDYHDYHHTQGTCAASGLFKLAVSMHILVSAKPALPV